MLISWVNTSVMHVPCPDFIWEQYSRFYLTHTPRKMGLIFKTEIKVWFQCFWRIRPQNQILNCICVWNWSQEISGTCALKRLYCSNSGYLVIVRESLLLRDGDQILGFNCSGQASSSSLHRRQMCLLCYLDHLCSKWVITKIW